MRQFIGRMTMYLASIALVSLAAPATADAPAWVRSMPGGPEVTLSMSSIDEADRSLRDLARSAQIDWLPTAGRLLSATNLDPGVDTTRPIAFGFTLEDASDEARLCFLAVIPADRPSMIAANFEALPSAEFPGLFSFEFAARPYFARVLPDDHLAISGSPALLLSLTATSTGPAGASQTVPIALTLRDERSLDTLALLLEESRLPQTMDRETRESVWPDGVGAITVNCSAAADALSLTLRFEADPGSERAQRWQAPEPIELGRIPFPSAEAMIVMQGSMADPATADALRSLAGSLLGIDPDVIAAADGASLLVESPANLLEISKIGTSLALESRNPSSLREAIADAIENRSGGAIARNAATRVGVSIDRFRLSGADEQEPTNGGFGRLLSDRRSEQRQIDGRMFVRNDRVYLTTISTEAGLDRLIVFGPEGESIATDDLLGDWLRRLPAGVGGRLALNVRPLATASVIGASFQGGRIDLPDALPPIVASLRTGDSQIEVTVVAPAQVIQLLDEIRRVAAEVERNRR